jgi:transglutaminase-like putative cysteine protease
MHIRIGYDLAFDVPEVTPMILMLTTHHSRAADILATDQMLADPAVPLTTYRDGFGNWCTRLLAPAGRIRLSARGLIEDSGLADAQSLATCQSPVQDLPPEALVFLLGSRYCETDRLADTAWTLFGHGPTGARRVQAICDFVHRHIRFSYMDARSTRTALDVMEQRVGVCRDFAHLAIALCRCLNIPARYCTGYLGDIGVPAAPEPMDFAAWFEAYLDGDWYTFDARNNQPRIGRVLIARGRDATDVPLSNIFGVHSLAEFSVCAEQVRETPEPVGPTVRTAGDA